MSDREAALEAALIDVIKQAVLFGRALTKFMAGEATPESTAAFAAAAYRCRLASEKGVALVGASKFPDVPDDGHEADVAALVAKTKAAPEYFDKMLGVCESGPAARIREVMEPHL